MKAYLLALLILSSPLVAEEMTTQFEEILTIDNDPLSDLELLDSDLSLSKIPSIPVESTPLAEVPFLDEINDPIALPEKEIDSQIFDQALTPALPIATANPISQPIATSLVASPSITKPLKESPTASINLALVFAGAPIIYSLLIALSIIAFAIWLHALVALREGEIAPKKALELIRKEISSHSLDAALKECLKTDSLATKVIETGLSASKMHSSSIRSQMEAEGKRLSAPFWHKMGILGDIAVIAPMLGLLGTVTGMFVAFYGLNRSTESISLLFDGLGVSVGTTVAGLVVAILAMLLQSSTKYKLVNSLAKVECETEVCAALLESINQSK